MISRLTATRLVVLSAMALCFACAAVAHPPKDIKLTFDQKSKVLSVNANHDVKNPTAHYIKEVKVYLDGKEIISQKMSSQTDEQSQVVRYVVIDAKPGSILKVEADCSRIGDKKKELKVGR